MRIHSGNTVQLGVQLDLKELVARLTGVTSSDDDGRSVLLGLDGSVQEGERTSSKVGEPAAFVRSHQLTLSQTTYYLSRDPLENTSGSVPEDGLGLQDSLPEELVGLFATVEPLPVGLDTLGVGSGTTLGVVGKVLGGDVVCRTKKRRFSSRSTIKGISYRVLTDGARGKQNRVE